MVVIFGRHVAELAATWLTKSQQGNFRQSSIYVKWFSPPRVGINSDKERVYFSTTQLIRSDKAKSLSVRTRISSDTTPDPIVFDGLPPSA